MNTKNLAVFAFILYMIGEIMLIFCAVVGAPMDWLSDRLDIACTLIMFVFSAVHADAWLGRRRMVVFLVIGLVLSFLSETLGVLTGLIFGPYYYTDVLGVKLGVVPVLIPLAWFMMLYPSNALIEILAGNISSRELRNHLGLIRTVGWNAWLAFLGAMAIAAWDLGVDPLSVPSEWVWPEGGAYFGIPVHNFIGWLGSAFVILFLYRTYETTQPARIVRFDNRFSLLPVAAYAMQALENIVALIATGRPATAMVVFFAMGTFSFLAATRLAQMRLAIGKDILPP